MDDVIAERYRVDMVLDAILLRLKTRVGVIQGERAGQCPCLKD